MLRHANICTWKISKCYDGINFRYYDILGDFHGSTAFNVGDWKGR